MRVKNRAVIRRLSLKTLWASRKRNLIAVAAIALTALLFTSLFTIALSINESQQVYTFRQLGGFLHGTFKDVTAEQAAAIAAHPKVKETGLRTVIGFLSTGSFGKTPAEISCMDDNCAAWSYALPTTGRMPRDGKEIVMDLTALDLLGVEPELGAHIQLTWTVSDKNDSYFEKTDTFTLVGWWAYDNICPVHYINVSEAYAEELQTQVPEPLRADLNVMMVSSLDIRGQMEQVNTDLGFTWDQPGGENNVDIGVNWAYTSSRLSSGVDWQTVAAIAALIALVVFTGYLVIYNIFQISVSGDIRFYGLLKTIGVTPRQLKRIIRWQALTLCAAGIPLGLVLGYGTGALLAPLVMANLNVKDSVAISASPVIFLLAAVFALVTVLLSCARPGRLAAKVSPVEAVRYTENSTGKRKYKRTVGARVWQMALANLSRNRTKTFLVVLSLALSVVLLNVLIQFVGGFDMETYLGKQTCADFIVSSSDYFRFRKSGEYLSQAVLQEIQSSVTESLSGCGYTIGEPRPQVWMEEAAWRKQMERFVTGEEQDAYLSEQPRREGLVADRALIEGLDLPLLEKLRLVEGDLTPLSSPEGNAIALAVATDDYGNVEDLSAYPAIGESLTISYITEAYCIDIRTGEKCTASTPDEYLRYSIVESRDVTYTVCAYVVVPHSMSYRYGTTGYELVLWVEALARDSGQTPFPLFYLFDTPDAQSEAQAEAYLARRTEDDSQLMYESKATLRTEFARFQSMFLILGGLLCAIIGVVGVLNFFNAIMTGILSRQREFAVLQAVGMTARQLKAMLIWEGLFYAFASAALALAGSLILSPLAAGLLERMFWFIRADFTIWPVLTALPVFALLGWAIPSLLYGQAAGSSVVERLRKAET